MSGPEPQAHTGVVLRDVGTDIVEIAALRDNTEAVRDLAAARGWPLPGPGQVRALRGGLALCVRPQRWLLLSPLSAPGAAQRDWHNVLGGHAASLDASSALQALHVGGRSWRAMLARGCRIDLDPQVFAPGRAAATLIAQVSVILAVLEESLLILTPATTGRHFREWLQATSTPFGFDSPQGATVELFHGAMHA